MTWLDTETEATNSTTEFDSVLSLQPKLLEKYRTFMVQLWRDDVLPHRIIDLCRLGIAVIHGCDAELAWRAPGGAVTDQELQALRQHQEVPLAAKEQLALTAAQLIPHQHHNLTDEHIHGLQAAFGNSACVQLLTACAFFDVNCRLKLSLGIATQPDSAVADKHLQPPLLQGALL